MWKEIKLSSTLDRVSGRYFSCISFKLSAAACCFKKQPQILIDNTCVTLMSTVLEDLEHSLLMYSGKQGEESFIYCRIPCSYSQGKVGNERRLHSWARHNYIYLESFWDICGVEIGLEFLCVNILRRFMFGKVWVSRFFCQ